MKSIIRYSPEYQFSEIAGTSIEEKNQKKKQRRNQIVAGAVGLGLTAATVYGLRKDAKEYKTYAADAPNRIKAEKEKYTLAYLKKQKSKVIQKRKKAYIMAAKNANKA